MATKNSEQIDMKRLFTALVNTRPPTFLSAAAASILMAIGAATLGVHFNLTPSLPMGIYLYTDDQVEPWESVVTFCPPLDAAAYALERGYLHRGNCPGEIQPLGKYVIAMAGDTVTVRQGGLRVNGRFVPNSATYYRDSVGRELPHYPFGTHVIGPDSVWMFSGHHPRSFDSRYFGPVSESSIISVARPIWVTDNR